MNGYFSGTLVCYGFIATALMVDFKPKNLSRKNNVFSFIYFLIIVLINILFMNYIGQPYYGKLYIFLAQLPVFIFFCIFSNYKGIKLIFALISAVTFAAPPVLILNLIISTQKNNNITLNLIIFAILCIAMLLFIYKFIKLDFNYMLTNCESSHFYIFSAIPLCHYLYRFSLTKYNFTSNIIKSNFLIQTMPTLIVLASYVLLIRIFRITREKNRLENDQTMIFMQVNAAKMQIKSLYDTQEQSYIYRHDMRHHINLLSHFAIEDDLNRIKEYLETAKASLDKIESTRYCENDTVNLILISFAEQAKKKGTVIHADIKLPQEININELELCSLLSNALENAIEASSKVEDINLRKVYVKASLNKDNLLIATENAFAGKIEMDGELPKSKSKLSGHGFGIKSMINIVKRYNGLYSIETSDNFFVLQLLIPLKTI